MSATDSKLTRPSEAHVTSTRHAAKSSQRPVLARLTHLLNPLILKLAGRRYVRAYAVIEHRGRRSGRTYATPVAAQPTADGFVIPMAFGEQADWFRNVQAAGECVVRWNGTVYHVVEPELLDEATGRRALGPVERLLAPLFARQFVHLRYAPSSAGSVAGSVHA
ncbi:MAG TPA: nitroreductase family deazaflavin-dependent oxidoreductase [Ktedonobacterales bacterium]